MENADKKPEDDWSCCVCLKLILDPIVLPCCGNDFCKDCLLRWAEQRSPLGPVDCPLCRASIGSLQDVQRLGECLKGSIQMVFYYNVCKICAWVSVGGRQYLKPIKCSICFTMKPG